MILQPRGEEDVWGEGDIINGFYTNNKFLCVQNFLSSILNRFRGIHPWAELFNLLDTYPLPF